MVRQRRSKSLIFKLIQGYGDMHHWVKFCVNRWRKSEVIELRSFCIAIYKRPRSRSRSFIFKLIQDYGAMHHWVKFCVNWCMKSEVIGLTSFVTDAHMHWWTPSISMYPPMDSQWHSRLWRDAWLGQMVYKSVQEEVCFQLLYKYFE